MNIEQILKMTGVSNYNKVVIPTANDKMFKPHNDSLLAEIKNRTSGTYYKTPYRDAVEDLCETVSVIRDEVTRSNELQMNFKPLLEGLMDEMLEKGYYTSEELMFETSAKVALDMDNARAAGKRYVYTARFIIKLYAEEIGANQNEITALVNAFRSRLAGTDDYRTYDLSKDNERQIVEKARRIRLIQEEEDDALSFFYARKEVITNKYMLLANSRSLGKSEYGRALLFAGLYSAILASEGSALQKSMEKAVIDFENKMYDREGRLPYPEEIEEEMERHTAGFSVRRFGSLFSLYPYGLIDILNFFRSGTFKEHKPAPVNVSVMFSYPNGEPSNAQKEAMVEYLMGRDVEFNNGVLVGTNFRINQEDRYRKNDVQKTLRDEDMLDIQRRRGSIYADAVRKLNFRQNVWRDGHCAGRVAYVTAYKSGVKLWLQDYRVL